jgi:pilus assembly protein Flp/PilA
MLRYIAKLQTRLSQDRGATAVEYGLLVALIAAIIVGVVGVLGTTIRDAFQTVVGELA